MKSNKLNNSENEEAYGDFKVKQSKFGNTVAKIITLLCAMIIWLFAATGENSDSEYTFTNIPVTLTNIPKGMSAFSGTTNVVDVTVVGKRNEINKLTKDEIKIFADCSSIETPGRYDIDLHAELKDGISLKALSKDTAYVHISSSATKELKIDVEARNYTIPPSCTLKYTITTEQSVTVSGPKDELEKISYAAVIIYPGNMTESRTCSGTISLFTADHEEYTNAYVTTSVDQALVQVELIATKDLTLTVDSLHGHFDESNSNITVSPSKISVSGSYEVLSLLESISVYKLDESAVINCSEINATLKLPDGVKSTDGITEVTVKVELFGTEDRTIVFPKELITVYGKNSKYDYTILNDIKISVRLPENYYSLLSPTDFSVTIDVSKCTEENSTVVAAVLLKNERTGAYILSDTDKNVTVTISEHIEPADNGGELE